jgi:hypothetical protein
MRDGITAKTARSSTRDRKETLRATPVHQEARQGLNDIMKFGAEKFDELMRSSIKPSLEEDNDDNDDEDEDDVENFGTFINFSNMLNFLNFSPQE